MRKAVKTGASFGLTSGTITTLGLMVGLYSGTHSRLAVIGGVLTIAIADALSDGLGIHISEESDKKNTTKQVWLATFSAFIAKFFYASTFLIPLLLFELGLAVRISVVYGLVVLGVLSYYIARGRGLNRMKMVGEHLGIAIVVIFVTYFVGRFISSIFG